MEGKEEDPPVEPPGFDVTKKSPPPALKDRAAIAEYLFFLLILNMGKCICLFFRAETAADPEAEHEPEGEYEPPPEPEHGAPVCLPECGGERGCYHMPMLERPVCSCPPNK